MRRVLFIISGDFGELGLAILFARNQEFSSHFSIPEKLYHYFDEPGIESSVYREFSDIPRVVNEFRPDIVMLFSGYLFTINGLATRRELSELKILLSQRKIKMATSDPFIRVYDKIKDMQFSTDVVSGDFEKIELQWLNDSLGVFNHIYNHPCHNDVGRSVGFFNSKYLYPLKHKKVDSNKRWAFVISTVDVRIQYNLYGEEFLKLVNDRINDILVNEINLVYFVAPFKFVKQYLTKYGANNRLEFVEYCTTQHFEKYICRSDVVFYWNIFSNSILLCWYSNIPALFFDIGHIGHLNAELNAYISERVYNGCEPDMISIHCQLDSNIDVVLKEHYSNKSRDNIMASQKSLSSPVDIVQSIFK